MDWLSGIDFGVKFWTLIYTLFSFFKFPIKQIKNITDKLLEFLIWVLNYQRDNFALAIFNCQSKDHRKNYNYFCGILFCFDNRDCSVISSSEMS